MHLKQKGHCFGVLLIYTITTITLPSVGWCEPAVHSSLLLLRDRSSVLTTKGLTHPSNREGTKRPHLDSRPGGGSRNLPDFHTFQSRDGTQTKASKGRPEQTVEPNMAPTSTGKHFKNRNKPKRMSPSLNPPNEGCRKGNIKLVTHGKFYIIGQLEANIPKAGYQADSAGSVQVPGGQERIRGQRVRGSEESWQKLQPVVECGDYAMTLTVRRRRAVQLLMDRVNESSVPLSQLPPQCGYSVQTTWRDLSLMAQYDACHVTQEHDSYVLPLLWRGTPVKMTCPVSQIQPQAVGPSSLCCFPYGMTVKVQGLYATEELRVNVRGEWLPLEVLAEQCGYTVDRQDTEIVIAASFITCGVTVKDGKYTLSLQFKEKTFRLACPVFPPEELPLTHQPLVNSPHHLTRRPTEHMEPFPWAPPFYLAPPYYPHPTYNHNYPSPDGHDAYNPPTPSSPTPDSTFGPQPLPPVDSRPSYQDYYSHQIPVRESYKHFGVHSSPLSTDDMEDSSQVYPDVQQKQETPVLGLSEKHSATHPPSSDGGFPIEAPPLQTPSHAFNQYYHYYHHPKIPLPGPPQDPDPGPELPKEPSSTNSHNPEFPLLPPNVQQSETLSRVNSDQFLQPFPEARPYTLPTNAPYTPYPPQLYPYHYFYYFPHIARGEAKRLAPLNPDMAAKTNLSDSQNTKSSTFVHPRSLSSEVHNKYNLNPYTDQPKPDKMILSNKHPLLSEDDVTAERGDKERHSAPVTPALPPSYPPGQPPFPASSPNHNLPPYPYYYYYHPYYYYYKMYYGPYNLLSTDSHVSPTSPKETLDLLLQGSSSPPQHPSYRKHQTTTPPTKSMYDVHNGPLHPYYYHLYYQPKVSVDNQELHPAGSMNSESESQLPSDYSWMDWPVNPYDQHPQDQHPHDPFGRPDDEKAEERLDNEMKDHLKANPYTASASPCALGPVSDFDCSVSLDCCSYPVKDCTMGEHLMFVVPDSVVEPTVPVAPPAHPSEVSNVSCTLQRLTSDPDSYIVPLDGCGVNKHVFGQTVVHLLEVHGFHSDHSSVHENSPVRLMVVCSSSPGSPGEVRLHVMDQPPPPPVQSTPATVTVQLRIATDESFTHFHPEAHLPLSLMRGRPVYVEVSLLDPPEPSLTLLVHSCLAYTEAPYTSWTLVYDGCPSRGASELLPSSHSDPHHIRRIIISSFLSLPSESSSYMAKGEFSHLQDPEIYFLCLTDVCSAADGDCTVGCINSPNSDV